MTSVIQSALTAFTVLAAVCPWLSLAMIVQYQECSSESKIRRMEVDDCNAQPCRVSHRSTLVMTAFLTSPINSSSAEWEIRAFINGRPYGHPEPVSDACISANSTTPTVSRRNYLASSNSGYFRGSSSIYAKSTRPICPLSAGKFYRFTHAFYVHDQFPKVATMVQYLLRGDKGQMIACARLHIFMST